MASSCFASRNQITTTPDGEALNTMQLAQRRKAHLPSSLAMNRGHTDCAELLDRVGL
jgi:hypothetical protein